MGYALELIIVSYVTKLAVGVRDHYLVFLEFYQIMGWLMYEDRIKSYHTLFRFALPQKLNAKILDINISLREWLNLAVERYGSSLE